MHYGQGSVAVRAERKPCFQVKTGGIRAGADWQGSHNLAVIRVDYDHQLVRTDRKQSAVFAIYRQPARLFAGRNRPVVFHCQLI